ncbi:hypothetical protein EYC80_009528 [Monilinia laxa]|uniref:Uncharacterized protein n=1 Tax=Monilinia laxa TaxID=61186 RepID=A0A5N6JY35_MONLA|nr:hypothetical protein EYC80_009528 [Monilinia laxa]
MVQLLMSPLPTVLIESNKVLLPVLTATPLTHFSETHKQHSHPLPLFSPTSTNHLIHSSKTPQEKQIRILYTSSCLDFAKIRKSNTRNYCSYGGDMFLAMGRNILPLQNSFSGMMSRAICDYGSIGIDKKCVIHTPETSHSREGVHLHSSSGKIFEHSRSTVIQGMAGGMVFGDDWKLKPL